MFTQLKVYISKLDIFLQAYTFPKSGAKQKLVFKGEDNRTLEAATCSKATTSSTETLEELSSSWIANLSPKVKAEKSGKKIARIEAA